MVASPSVALGGKVGRTLRAWAYACALVAGAALAPGAAAAQQDVADLVVLPGGGRVRGIVIEYEPGVRVVLRTPAGETRTWTAGQFERVELAGGRADAPVAVPPGAPPGAVASPPASSSATPAAPPPTAPAEPTPTRWSTAHHFEDGSSARVRWMDDTPAPQALARGTRHFGARALFAISPEPTLGPVLEVDATFEIRASETSAWRLRVDAGIGLDLVSDAAPGPFGSSSLSTAPVGYVECSRSGIRCEHGVTSNGPYFALRALLELDPSPKFLLRLGAELDIASVSLDYATGGTTTRRAYGGLGVFEVGARLMSGHVETGVQVAAGGVPTQETAIDPDTFDVVAHDYSPRATLRLALFVGAAL